MNHLFKLTSQPVRANFFKFGGLPAPRLNVNRSVYTEEKRSNLILALSWAFNVALFGAPESHMNELKRVWVDRGISLPQWKSFNNNLISEWSGITIYVRTMIVAVWLLLLLNRISQL
jgi:hypothetical protein